MAVVCGRFVELHVEVVVDVEPGTWVEDFDRMLGTAPNPSARTTEEAIAGSEATDGNELTLALNFVAPFVPTESFAPLMWRAIRFTASQ